MFVEELFKYRGNLERDLKTLVSNNIYASTLDNMNDPFEGMLDSQFDEVILNSDNCSKYLPRTYTTALEMIKEHGIYSLSADCRNELLWSFYANAHKGFIVGYDINKLITSFNYSYPQALTSKLKVNYLTQPKGLLQYDKKNYNSLNMCNGLGIKSTSWKYENETRLVFEKSGLYEYHYAAVSRIIFGLRTSEKYIDQTMKVLKGRNYSYQKVLRVDKSFKMIIVDIPDKYYERNSYQQNFADFDESLLKNIKLRSSDPNFLEKAKVTIQRIRTMPNISKLVSLTIHEDPSVMTIEVCNYDKPSIVHKISFKYLQGEFYKIP